MVIIHGGSFNPVTNGHVELENKLANRLNCSVLMTPCYENLLKNNLVDSNHRLKMCEIVCNKNPKLNLCKFEINYKLSGSTLELIKFMHEFNDLKEAYFIIGMDNANTIYKWKNYKELLNIGKFIVIPRIGFKEDPNIDWYKKSPHIYLSDIQVQESYSTNIRKAFKNNNLKEAKKYLDEDVFNYIINNNLYL